MFKAEPEGIIVHKKWPDFHFFLVSRHGFLAILAGKSISAGKSIFRHFVRVLKGIHAKVDFEVILAIFLDSGFRFWICLASHLPGICWLVLAVGSLRPTYLGR